jgi:hypothetical protein
MDDSSAVNEKWCEACVAVLWRNPNGVARGFLWYYEGAPPVLRRNSMVLRGVCGGATKEFRRYYKGLRWCYKATPMFLQGVRRGAMRGTWKLREECAAMLQRKRRWRHWWSWCKLSMWWQQSYQGTWETDFPLFLETACCCRIYLHVEGNGGMHMIDEHINGPDPTIQWRKRQGIGFFDHPDNSQELLVGKLQHRNTPYKAYRGINMVS